MGLFYPGCHVVNKPGRKTRISAFLMIALSVYPAYTIVPAAMFAVFFLLAAWFIISAINQAQKATSPQHLLMRITVALIIPVIVMGATLFIFLYMNAKRIEVDDQFLRTYTLFDSKEIAWKDVSSIDANFTLTTRLGLTGKNSYAWIDLQMRSGETVHISLRFLAGTSELEGYIRQKFPKLGT